MLGLVFFQSTEFAGIRPDSAQNGFVSNILQMTVLTSPVIYGRVITSGRKLELPRRIVGRWQTSRKQLETESVNGGWRVAGHKKNLPTGAKFTVHTWAK